MRPRMNAKICSECDVTRLFEVADEIAGAQYGLKYGGRIAGIGAEITVAEVSGREQWRAARDVEHDVAARHGAISRRSKGQRVARGGTRRGVIVYDDLERAKMALGCADRPLHDRKIGGARRRQIMGPRDQHGDIEMFLEQAGRLEGGGALGG